MVDMGVGERKRTGGRERVPGVAAVQPLAGFLLVLSLSKYWHRQMEKSQNARHRKQYEKAWKRALAAWQVHPLSATIAPEQLRQWQAWAEWMCEQFHRSSSAVEGRNGCLAQMYHCGRGLTQKRLAALTVIHNFGLKRTDGTTAAERFFGAQFPDLFEWLMEQMGPLPLPRKGRVRVAANPLNLELVPA